LCESKLNLGYGPRKGFRLMLQDDETVRRNVCNYYSNYKTSHHRYKNIQKHGYENLMRKA